jgi:hypothetical protein
MRITTAIARLALAASALAVALATSGCESVEGGGGTGMSVDAAGNPVVVLALCEGYVDGIVLSTQQGESTHEVGRWDSATPVDTDQTVNLGNLPASWRAGKAQEPLRDGVEYTVFGGTRSNRWFTGQVSFTTTALKHLRPGQVLHQEYDDSKDGDRDVVTDAAGFRAYACNDS